MADNLKKFLDSLNDFIGVDNYYTFFENEDVDGSGPWMVSDIVFGFTYIKLLDTALEYSKEDVLREYEKNRNSNDLDEILMNTAVYPTGETLGFYNTSIYDLEKLSESGVDISAKLNEYIDGFSKNVKVVFDKLCFSDVLKFLEKTCMTYDVLRIFSENQIEGDFCSCYEKFTGIFSDFIRIIWRDEFYHIGRDPIATYDAFSSYHYIHEALKEYGSFLNSLLLSDVDFENNDDIKIYDPDSSGTYILDETKNLILMSKRNSSHPDGNVEIYGKSKKMENEMIYLAKRSVTKKDPYEIEGAIILDADDDIFSLEGIESYSDFDLIVSNYLYNGFDEYKDILETFNEKSDKSTKMVIALDNFDGLGEIIANDNLESIISFKNHYIIIANLNKPEPKRGHFLLIDESDAETTDETVARENRQAFSNNEYDIFNAPHWKTLTDSDHAKMKAILKSYQAFEDSINSRLIENEDYDEEMMGILLN